ncbi:hypothetical protein UFOVP1439_20 [uncultured Caudovirales phage]|uniref:Uncharacterized protein n=1 Tax=uncultured Caudovirales phage TaxID=2100421 RepID=A0A6J5QUW4_9CAUD|nr:hypothetical protein UFOVP1085_57 [uncultured Caudovirales phage]CAB4212505.1 hypothetical protein UFOVP1439_20 [uncultured Caudovirales phage]
MADTKFSNLPSATLAGTEVVPIVQGVTPSRTTPNAIAGLATKTTVGLGNVVNLDTSTTANITDSANKRFVTDTQSSVLALTSGTNTGDGSTPPETVSTIGTLISGATLKNPPIDADSIGLSDSVASNVLKKLTWANVKAALKTYFDTLYPSGSGTSTGSNTGDQTSIVGISGTKAQFDTAVSDGNILYVGDVTSNVTHTGDVTGSGALTIDPTAITGKTIATAVGGDYVLISDTSASGQLKKALVSDLAGSGSFTVSTAEINFGTVPVKSKRITVTDAAITTASKIMVTPNGATATGRVGNDWEWDTIDFSVVAGTGNFLLTGTASGRIKGKRNIYYTYS